MNDEKQFFETNQKSWDTRVDTHVDSEFYNNKAFIAGENSLKEIEIAILGDVKGLKILHLQCHFGQDSISLSRMGAEVTGIDFSPKAIETAKELAIKTGQNTRFICSNIYDLPEVFNEQFDLVYTAYNYFNSGPIIENEIGTYADKNATISSEYVMWNHDFGEVLGSLLSENLELKQFQEYDFSPYNCFSHTIEIGLSRFRIAHLKNYIPMVYSLVMEKK